MPDFESKPSSYEQRFRKALQGDERAQQRILNGMLEEARSQQGFRKAVRESMEKKGKGKVKYLVAFYMGPNYFLTNNGLQFISYFKNYSEIERELIDFAGRTGTFGRAICMVYPEDRPYSYIRSVVFGKPLKVLGVSDKGAVRETEFPHVKF